MNVVGLGRGRPGQEGEFLVRREQALPHQRGRRHLEVHPAEQRPVQYRLLGGHQVRRGRGQPDDPGLAELPDQRLAAAGRHHQVGGAVTVGHVAVQRGERADLVWPQRAAEADTPEHVGQPAAGRPQCIPP